MQNKILLKKFSSKKNYSGKNFYDRTDTSLVHRSKFNLNLIEMLLKDIIKEKMIKKITMIIKNYVSSLYFFTRYTLYIHITQLHLYVVKKNIVKELHGRIDFDVC